MLHATRVNSPAKDAGTEADLPSLRRIGRRVVRNRKFIEQQFAEIAIVPIKLQAKNQLVAQR
jgi:hypothetical protein